LDKFIADFYCHEVKLVIEVDGSVHDNHEVKEYDEGRTYELKELGITVVRFRNEEVLEKIGEVLKRIREVIEKLDEKR
jgi:very-short-patch-repair endonuclease